MIFGCTGAVWPAGGGVTHRSAAWRAAWLCSRTGGCSPGSPGWAVPSGTDRRPSPILIATCPGSWRLQEHTHTLIFESHGPFLCFSGPSRAVLMRYWYWILVQYQSKNEYQMISDFIKILQLNATISNLNATISTIPHYKICNRRLYHLQCVYIGTLSILANAQGSNICIVSEVKILYFGRRKSSVKKSPAEGSTVPRSG